MASVYQLRYVHLVAAIFIAASIFYKFNQEHEVASFFKFFTTIVYVFPNIVIFNTIKPFKVDKYSGLIELQKRDQINQWLELENQMFIFQVYG